MNDDAGDETTPLPTTAEATGLPRPDDAWKFQEPEGRPMPMGVSISAPIAGWTRKAIAISSAPPVAPSPSTQSIAMISYIDTRPRPVLDVLDRVTGTEQHFEGKPGEDRSEFLDRVLSS